MTPHSSPRVWPFRSCSRSSSCRRVGSASALNTRSSSPATPQSCRHLPACQPGLRSRRERRPTAGGRRRRSPVLARARAARAGRRARALPARAGAGEGVARTSRRPRRTTARTGRSPTRCRTTTSGWPSSSGSASARSRRCPIRTSRAWRPGSTTGRGTSRRAVRRSCRRPPSSRSRRRRPTSPRRSPRGARIFKVHVQVGGFDPRDRAARPGVGAAGGDRDAGGHPLRLRAAAPAGTRGPSPMTGLLRAVSPAAAGDRAPRHAGVPGVPRPGRALRRGAPGHHDVRDRLHRGG